MRIWVLSFDGPALSPVRTSIAFAAVSSAVGGRVVIRGRGVVDLGDRDRQGRRVAQGVVGAVGGAVVADLVGQLVGAEVVGGRDVLDGAIRVDRGPCRASGSAVIVTSRVWPASFGPAVSPVRTSIPPAVVSSAVVAVSSFAVGASLTSVTVILKVGRGAGSCCRRRRGGGPSGSPRHRRSRPA